VQAVGGRLVAQSLLIRESTYLQGFMMLDGPVDPENVSSTEKIYFDAGCLVEGENDIDTIQKKVAEREYCTDATSLIDSEC
jgi:hypothetical protein